METEWEFFDSSSSVLPAGKYYIGDVCHTTRKAEVYYETACLDGLYESSEGSFVITAAAKGNSIYIGSDQIEYVVTSGTIGIISKSLIADDAELHGGSMYDFPTGLTVTAEYGELIIDSDEFCMKIDTNEKYEEAALDDWI